MPSRHKPASLFFFNDTATTEIYTLSLHDALPIYPQAFDVRPLQNWISLARHLLRIQQRGEFDEPGVAGGLQALDRSEEHTSELQSQSNLVCRLLLEKKILSRAMPWLSREIKSFRS